MKYIIGLGNPGERYKITRHNLGFMLLDVLRDNLATDHKCEAVPELTPNYESYFYAKEELWLVKPLTYMNNSGDALSVFFDQREELGLDLSPPHFDLSDCLVICDDYTLPFGRLRFRGGGSDGGHNGLASVSTCFGSLNWPRLRVGIGQRPCQTEAVSAATGVEEVVNTTPAPGTAIQYVLSVFTSEEQELLPKLLQQLVLTLHDWRGNGLVYCQNRYNGMQII